MIARAAESIAIFSPTINTSCFQSCGRRAKSTPYLTNDYLAWWERELTVEAANSDDAHRPLDKSHNLAASLSHVETRQVRNDYTLQWDGKLYQIKRQAISTGLRKAAVRVEERLDGSLAVRHGERYLPVEEWGTRCKPT